MRAAALLVAALLAACGQTGPLYLPDEGVRTPVEIRGPSTPAPASSVQPVAEPDDDDDEPRDPPADR